MRKQIVIRLARPNGPYEASWLVLDNTQDEQPAVIKTGSLAEAAAACEGVQATVLVPAETVFLTMVSIPTSNQRRILNAVPYALEDQLAQDIDDLHFCAGKRNGQGKVPAAAVAHRQMEEWQAQLQELGIQVDVLTSEVFALPIEVDSVSWSLLLEDQMALLRTGNESGYCVDTENVGILLSMAFEAAGDEKPQRLNIYDAREHGAAEIGLDGVELTQHLLHEPAIALMSGALPKAGFSLNLLQGEYSRKEQMSKVWRPWLPVAILAAAWFVVNFAVALTESIRMENKAEVLQQQIESLYLEAFPGAREQTAQGIIESETKRRLADLRGGGGTDSSDFLILLNMVGERFSQTQSLVLERVSYRAGKLDVALTIGDLQRLDMLKQQLVESKKLAVDIQSATSRDGKVEARLQIERSGA